jgi:hypothetical protein
MPSDTRVVEQRRQAREVECAQHAHIDERRPRPRLGETPHERLRPADVGRKNHRMIVCAGAIMR